MGDLGAYFKENTMKERALKWLLGKGISLSYTFRFEWTGFNNETKGKTKGEGRDLDVGGIAKGDTIRRKLALWQLKERILKEEQMLEKIKLGLSGKKTYLVALGSIIGVVIAWTNGTISNEQAVDTLIQSVLAMTVRAGIKQ